MALAEDVRTRLTEAMKAKSPDKDIYRLLLAKCQTDGATTDEQVIVCVRSIMGGNIKAIEKTKEEAAKNNVEPPAGYFAKLEAENKVLATFLPQYLDAAAIRKEILGDEKILGGLITVKNDGAAVGAVMALFKLKELKVEGKTVKDVVTEIRKAIEVIRPLMKTGAAEEIRSLMNEQVGN